LVRSTALRLARMPTRRTAVPSLGDQRRVLGSAHVRADELRGVALLAREYHRSPVRPTTRRCVQPRHPPPPGHVTMVSLGVQFWASGLCFALCGLVFATIFSYFTLARRKWQQGEAD